MEALTQKHPFTGINNQKTNITFINGLKKISASCNLLLGPNDYDIWRLYMENTPPQCAFLRLLDGKLSEKRYCSFVSEQGRMLEYEEHEQRVSK